MTVSRLAMWKRLRVARVPPDHYAAPTVTSCSPSTVSTSGGSSVTIRGTNFSGAGTSVRSIFFGSYAATSFTVTRSRTIVAVAPAQAAGAVAVTVQTMGGRASLAGAVTYVNTTVDGVRFNGSNAFASGYYGGTTLGTARVRFRLDEVPTTAFRILAGPNTGGGGDGWLLYSEDNNGAGGAGQIVLYAQVGASWARLFRKYFLPDDVGRIFTIHLVCDGANAWVYLDGHRTHVAVAGASIVASSQKMNLGASPAGANGSPVTILDVAEGTVALTPAQVAADALLSTPSFAGQTHRWVADASITTTWSDQVGTAHMTAVGTPVATNFTQELGNHLGALECFGDSITAGRRADLGLGDGWRRAVDFYVSAQGYSLTFVGFIPFTAATPDYDFYGTATPGQALSERLVTLAADLIVDGPPDAATLVAYGINDLAALSRTAVQLRADVATACGLIAAARPGRPIFICNILPVSTATATAPQHVQIDAYNAGFAAMITSLQATYPTVVGIDIWPAITDPNDTGQLYDGIHPSPTGYAAVAAIIGPAVVAAMT